MAIRKFKKLILVCNLVHLSFLLIYPFNSNGQDTSDENINGIKAFISLVKHRDFANLSKKVQYPLHRDYPIPEIGSEMEFMRRYKQIFDDSLIKSISSSDPTIDWSEMGYRGIMLRDGMVWLDREGNLIAVNYDSKNELKMWRELVAKEKGNLHNSIRKFERPICIVKTSNYRIRIDDMGDYDYRYCSWKMNKRMSEMPDLIILKGEYIPEGSGGNGRYEFRNGNLTFDVSIIEMGEDNSPPAVLSVYKDGKRILSENAKSYHG